MPKLFIPSNFSTSNLALETIVLTTKGFAENSTKAYLKESAEDFVEESEGSPDIFLINNQIHEPILKSSKRTNPIA